MTDVVLINKTKTEAELRDPDLQEANANALVDKRIKQNSSNNPVYIVKVEDPSVEEKARHFAALKLRDEGPIFLEVIGIELETKAQQDAIETYNDLQSVIQHTEMAIISIRFPWNRVISIKNQSYKQKKGAKNE